MIVSTSSKVPTDDCFSGPIKGASAYCCTLVSLGEGVEALI